jgi:hypothetical protein
MPHKPRMPRRLVLLAIALLTLAGTAPAHACPMCKDTVADPGNTADASPTASGDITSAGAATTTPQLGDAFSYSVLFMLAVPYTLLAATGTTAYVLYRRAHRAKLPAPKPLAA